jgi:CheY-like chemotaxis protein
MDKLKKLSKNLRHLGLFEKTVEIYSELGIKAAKSYLKSSYHLLSKVYHPDLNPNSLEKATIVQRQLNEVHKDLQQISDIQLNSLLAVRGDKEPPKTGKIKILIVEDEFGLKETFRDIFIMEGYEVRMAEDGIEGLKAFKSFRPDILFTDVVMPNMDGLELVKLARQEKHNIKVIYISGFFGIKRLKRDLDEELLRFNYRYLSKPFKISEMLEMVKEYLNEKALGVNSVA